jgi:voltage-gated potassium channel
MKILDEPKIGSNYGPKAREVERKLAPWMLGLTLLVVPSLLLEFSSNPTLAQIGHVLNWAIWLGFVIEAVLLIFYAKRSLTYLRTHPLELAIIVFTFPALPLSAHLMATLRLLRLLRLLKLPRTLRNIFGLSHVAEVGFVILTALVIGTIALDVLEPSLKTPVDSLWAAFNLTTTGELPEDLGRMAYLPATGLIVVGLIFVSYFTALIAAWIITEEQDGEWQEERQRENTILRQQEDILAQLAALHEKLDAQEQDKG